MHNACQQQTGVDEKFIAQSRDGFVADDPKLRCYVLCIFEYSGMVWFVNCALCIGDHFDTQSIYFALFWHDKYKLIILNESNE